MDQLNTHVGSTSVDMSADRGHVLNKAMPSSSNTGGFHLFTNMFAAAGHDGDLNQLIAENKFLREYVKELKEQVEYELKREANYILTNHAVSDEVIQSKTRELNEHINKWRESENSRKRGIFGSGGRDKFELKPEFLSFMLPSNYTERIELDKHNARASRASSVHSQHAEEKHNAHPLQRQQSTNGFGMADAARLFAHVAVAKRDIENAQLDKKR
jgi:hypothetical protein